MHPPRPCAIIARAAARLPRKTEFTLMSITRRHSAKSMSATGPTAITPALQTITSRPPCSATTRATAASTVASSVASPVIDRTPPPGVGFRSRPATLAPSARNRPTMPGPIPLADPLTRTEAPAWRFGTKGWAVIRALRAWGESAGTARRARRPWRRRTAQERVRPAAARPRHIRSGVRGRGRRRGGCNKGCRHRRSGPRTQHLATPRSGAGCPPAPSAAPHRTPWAAAR